MPHSNEHQRPDGVDDATVDAVGKISEAFELLQRARGSLYTFHQQMGWVDETLGDGIEMLEGAGHGELAQELRRRWLGRNVVPGMWTFQVVEAFEDTYHEVAIDLNRRVRDELVGGRRHVQEAEHKRERRQDGPSDDEREG
ncbi:MAG: hypothetical protein JJT89_09230 [Nitriliruptoraceae bacterium]|nr:hypothetical protein [Nitriliruptoraceae bacterium]